MKRFVHPLLLLLARATEKELVQTIEYLKTENRMLRNKLPKRIEVTPAERARLLKLGVRLGSKIKEIVTIVHPRTFARWLSESRSGREAPQAGTAPDGGTNPPTDHRDGQGQRLGLRADHRRTQEAASPRLAGNRQSRLARERFRPRTETRPRLLVRLHPTTYQDRLGDRLLHQDGVDAARTGHLLRALLHSPAHPSRPPGRHDSQSRWRMDGPDRTQHDMVFAEEPVEFQPTHIVRDRDSKFTAEFCSILETDGIEFRPIPPRSPNLNPFAEVWVQRTKHEVLNHFLVFGERHLRHIMEQWLIYYHNFRPHQGLGNVPISGEPPPAEPLERLCLDDVVCHESLGGLLRRYERCAVIPDQSRLPGTSSPCRGATAGTSRLADRHGFPHNPLDVGRLQGCCSSQLSLASSFSYALVLRPHAICIPAAVRLPVHSLPILWRPAAFSPFSRLRCNSIIRSFNSDMLGRLSGSIPCRRSNSRASRRCSRIRLA